VQACDNHFTFTPFRCKSESLVCKLHKNNIWVSRTR